MIVEGKPAHLVLPTRNGGKTVTLIQVEKIDYSRQVVYTGQFWVPLANCTTNAGGATRLKKVPEPGSPKDF